MTIDLSGLFTYDVEIRVKDTSILVLSHHKDINDDCESLPAPFHVQNHNTGGLVITPNHVDTIAFAERLSLTWETRGYKVKRLIIKTPYRLVELQSFVLL